VDDTVRGILAAAAHGLRGPVNIGNPTEITMLDLARLVVELTGSTSEIRFIERPTDDPAVRCPDITLARDKLEWEPAVSAEEGLLRTIDWFRAHPD
jgi:dTDP-glucose 4,6-dehydratase